MTASPKDRQQYALQTIFSFFLGLMVLAFIGIGVNTFYPQPKWERNPELERLHRQQDQIWNRDKEGKGLSAADEAELEAIQEQITEIEEAEQDRSETWTRMTSIILIVFATLVMGVSLIRSDQLRVISNGLLLGGLFTMIYGVGWIIASGESVMRFVVIVLALAVTLALGYLRFVRGREPAVAGGQVPSGVAIAGESGGIAPAAGVAELADRVAALESRQAAAAAALGLERSTGDREGES